MKKILISIATIALVGALGFAATNAFFSDKETSTGNNFTAGKLDLKIDSTAHYAGLTCTNIGAQGAAPVYHWLQDDNVISTRPELINQVCDGTWASKDLTQEKFFNLADIKPGDQGENTISYLIDNNPSWACVTIDKMVNSENTCLGPEATAGDTTCGTGSDQGELAQNLFFTAWADNGNNVWDTGEPLLFSNKLGAASDVLNGETYALADSTTGLGPLPGGVTKYIGLAWCAGTMTIDETAHTIKCDGSTMGNNTQTDSLTADISFYIEQSRNNPNFVCPKPEKHAVVVYNSIPDPLAGNYPSQAFEAQSASEFGGQIALTGTKRSDPIVTVVMSSWGCQNGHWNTNDCLTTPGSTFSEPITLNIYNVGASNAPGTVIATKTQTFNIPYRPSASASCTSGDAGKWFDSTTSSCVNGYATPISFDLSGVTLPDNVIVSLAYNTTDYGYSPIGVTACNASTGGCGYDSLNVAVKSSALVTYPLPNDAYLNSTWTGAYCNGALGTGSFRLDAGCWTGYQPVMKIEAI